MEAAGVWLDAGHALAKSDKLNVEALGPSNDIPDRALSHLSAIQNELAERGPDPDHKDLIAIAVDDMKIVSALMKLVVVYGIYPCIPGKSMVPLGPRVAWQRPPKPDQLGPAALARLKEISSAVYSIVLKGDDLSSLILISPFLVDLVAAWSFFPQMLGNVLSKIPTFNLYKILIPLRALPAPQPSIIQSLGELPIKRHDAVRTIIELVIEPKSQNDSQHVDLTSSFKAAQVLASIPRTISKVAYIQATGTQLFTLLTGSAGETLAKAASLVVAKLSEIQQRLIGELRNLLVSPFELPSISASASLAALMRLAETGESRHSDFFVHVAERVCLPLWLLVNASRAGKLDELNSAYVNLQAKIIEVDPAASLKAIVTNFTTNQIPSTRLRWIDVTKNEPTLVEFVGAGAQENEQGSLIQQIDARLDVLVTVLAKVADISATSMLIYLVQWYSQRSSDDNPLLSIVLAKTIERLAQDVNLRPKLFNDPDQIIDLAFNLIRARLSLFPTERKLETLTINADADSDDEGDSDDEMRDSEDDLTIVEMSLSLLGSALMESLGSSEHSKPCTSADQTRLLTRLTHNDSKSIRSKAEFCLQLLDGSRRDQKEVDMNNDAEVLALAKAVLQEPLVPSRAYGLYLFTKLVERHAVDLDMAMAVFLEELRDEDSYVYLNAIKGIEVAARTGESSRVLDLLLPAVGSSTGSLDTVLRAREALVRIISPGTASRLSAQLVETLLDDLKASARKTRDIRLRLSSCSLLGIIIANYPHALSATQENDAADCALGILRYEHETDEQTLHKAAVVLALEIVNAANEGAFATSLARSTLSSLITEIESTMQHTNDDVLLEHCRAVLESANLAS